jgi:wyosine [tRNA(Phe)-imidazoG37] synthetase (radical SAM superfamily)
MKQALHELTAPMRPMRHGVTPFQQPRNFLNNRYVYAVISPRAGGLSVGINLNPTKHCNFDCVYCEVDRSKATRVDKPVDVDAMSAELEETLKHVFGGELRANFPTVPTESLKLKHVALSGDGEPTLCPNFEAVTETVVHLRASTRVPYFKLVLITNASALDRPEVIRGINLLTHRDEVWVKLDGGSQEYIDQLNRPEVSLEKIMENIRDLGWRRPIVIQTMIPSIDGENPFSAEISEYTARLCELKSAGARISLIQIYSATRPSPHSECGHLPLNTLSAIARQVRAITGLRTEVF